MSEVQTKNIETLAYVVHDAKQPFKLETVVLDDLRDNEVLVDIQYSGICHTDLVFQQGEIKAINSRNVDDIVAHIKELTGGKGADYTVDCTGVPAVIENMLNILSMRGTAATVGVAPAGAKITIDPLVFLLGSRIYKGCREGDSNPPVFIPQLCKMQKEGHFPVEKLCRVYDYNDMESALHDLHQGKVTKPVIKWS